MQLIINEFYLRSALIFRVIWTKKVTCLDYHELNLSLMAQEIMRALVYKQLVRFPIWLKAIVVTSLYCFLFLASKSKDVKSYQRSVSIETSLDLKVCFSQVT